MIVGMNAAPEGDLIRARDIEVAATLAREELDRDFFETRATKAGRKYLAAMDELGTGPYASGEVAERGRWKTVMSAGPVRQTLIDKGLIYSPDHGRVDFTVPHFADFMRRRHPLVSLAPYLPMALGVLEDQPGYIPCRIMSE
jgi:hypothetical protein